MKFCPKCGGRRSGDSLFCTACGYRYDVSGESTRSSTLPKPVMETRINTFNQARTSVTTVSVAGRRKKKSSSLVMKELEEKYKIPLVMVTIAMVAGIIMFSIANYQTSLLEKPVQLQVLEDGGCIVASTRSLTRYSASGAEEWKLTEAGGNRFDSLLNFEFGPDGNMYVANPYRATIEVITLDGKWLRTIETGTRDSNFALSVLADGNLLIADARGHRLKLFSPDGGELEEIGRRGVGPYDLRFPNGIAVLPNGHVMIVDTNNQRFQLLDRDMRIYESRPFAKKAAVPGSESDEPIIISYDGEETTIAGEFFGCQAVADHGRGRIYVSFADDLIETPYGYIAIFDMEGNYIDRSMMKSADGRNVYAYTLKMTPGGKVSVADVDEYTAGIWDPDTGEYSETDNAGALAAMGEMKQKSGSNRLMYVTGIGIFGLCFVIVMGLVIYVQNKEESVVISKEKIFENVVSENKRTPRESLAAVEFLKSRMGSDEEVERAERSVRLFLRVAVRVVVGFELVSMAAIIVAKRHVSAAEYHRLLTVVAFALDVLLCAAIVLFFIAVRKIELYKKMGFVALNNGLRKLGPELAGIPLKGEEYIDIIALRTQNRRQVSLLLLTNMRLIRTGASGANMFSREVQVKARPLADFKNIRLKNYLFGFMPLITVFPARGKKKSDFVSDAARAEKFIERANEQIRMQPDTPAVASGGEVKICPECSRAMGEVLLECPYCGQRFKNPGTAALLSLALCGLGQFYNRQYFMGALFLIPFAVDAGILYIHFSSTAVVDLHWMIITITQHVIFTIASAVQAYKDAGSIAVD